MDGFSQLLFIKQVVALKYPRRFVARNGHGPGVVNPRAPGICDEGTAKSWEVAPSTLRQMCRTGP